MPRRKLLREPRQPAADAARLHALDAPPARLDGIERSVAGRHVEPVAGGVPRTHRRAATVRDTEVLERGVPLRVDDGEREDAFPAERHGDVLTRSFEAPVDDLVTVDVHGFERVPVPD